MAEQRANVRLIKSIYKDRLHAEASSIANRSSPSDIHPELQMLSPLHMHVHESCRRACRTKGNSLRKGYPMIHARYPELPFLTFAFELESKDPSSILRSSRSVSMECTSLSHDSRYRNPSSVRHHRFENRLLPSERAALSQPRLATSGLAPDHPVSVCCVDPRLSVDLQDLRAALADNDCVCVREDGGDGEASRALDVHEERAGSGHEVLELVLAGLTARMLVGVRECGDGSGCVRGRGGVEKVNCENLRSCQLVGSIETADLRDVAADGCEVKFSWQTPTVVWSRSRNFLAPVCGPQQLERTILWVYEKIVCFIVRCCVEVDGLGARFEDADGLSGRGAARATEIRSCRGRARTLVSASANSHPSPNPYPKSTQNECLKVPRQH
jgi:hypothetical protein